MVHPEHLFHHNVLPLDIVFIPLEISSSSSSSFFFYTLLTKCDFHSVQCLHRMFYSTRFVVSLHLCDTPPQ